ncbi:glycosyltransferase [Rummeliibacillus sp. JY-2-4R]
MMKVLQINSVCGIGSTGRIATDIHHLLKQHDHESFIGYGRGLPLNCENTIRIGTRMENYSHVALTKIYDKHGFGSIKATREFIRKMEEMNPDIIHLHNIHGYYINVELLFDYLKKANKPVIWTLHDCWVFTGHCSHFDYIKCEKWKTCCNKCPQKNEYPSSIIFDNSKINYIKKREIFTGIKNLTIVTPSEWLANKVKESFLHEYPIIVINNGIDMETFKPIKSNIRRKYKIEDKFIILGVASIWGERKGLKYFLKLSEKIKSNEIIILVGLNKTQKEKLPKNIIGITNTTDKKELAEIYTAADVFVNPTLEDNFPTTNLEALSCGTPVITFATGGSVESVDENCGFIVEKGDLEDMIEKIYLIKSSTNLNYSKNALIRARSLYRSDERYLDYLQTYEKALVNDEYE